jgi:hypothetical protein
VSTDNLFFLGIPNLLLNSTTVLATSSTESSGTASTNASFPDPKRVWRSTQDSASIEWDSGSSNSTFGGLYFTGHDMSTKAKFNVRLDNSTAYSGGSFYNSSTILVWGNTTGNTLGNHTAVWLSTLGNIQRRYIRLDVDDTLHNDIEIGFIGTGPSIQLSVGFNFGWSFKPKDLSSVIETPNGSVFSDVRPKMRQIDITNGFMTEDESFSKVVNQIYQRMGITNGFCVVPFPAHSSHQESLNFYCRLVDLGGLKGEAIPVARGPRFTTALSFKEIL